MSMQIHQGDGLAERLPGAAARGEFHLEYQPVVDLASEKTIGYEALLRWRLGGRDIPPNVFIPLAERLGALGPIWEWILERACSDRRQLSAGDTLFLNASAVQIRPDFAEDLLTRLERFGASAENFCIEITESLPLIDRANAAANFHKLRAKGLRIALDDFGTGFCGLEHLRDLPIDVVKIDGDFVHRAPHDPRSLAIIEAIASLGRNLGMQVLGEAVETQAQRACLENAGCALGQGYFFGAPGAIERWAA